MTRIAVASSGDRAYVRFRVIELLRFCRARSAYWTDRVAAADNVRACSCENGEATAMGIFSEIFSWWGGNTWGTRLTIWRQGRLVGKDEFGNRYYEQK